MILRETMRCRKVRRLLPYHGPNKHLAPETFALYVLLLFYLFRDESLLLVACLLLHQSKLQQQGVQAVLKMNKINLNHMVIKSTRLFLYFIGIRLAIKTHIGKLKMMKHQGQKIPMKMNQETQKKSKTSAITNFIPKILPDDEIAEGINSLKS